VSDQIFGLDLRPAVHQRGHVHPSWAAHGTCESGICRPAPAAPAPVRHGGSVYWAEIRTTFPCHPRKFLSGLLPRSEYCDGLVSRPGEQLREMGTRTGPAEPRFCILQTASCGARIRSSTKAGMNGALPGKLHWPGGHLRRLGDAVWRAVRAAMTGPVRTGASSSLLLAQEVHAAVVRHRLHPRAGRGPGLAQGSDDTCA